MKTKLLLLLFLVSLSTYAQYTAIPDVNFENKLIALRIDSGVADGEVLTSSINSLTYLNVSNSNITDLTGIQDFVSLIHLNCQENQLTTLDVSKNIALASLSCSSNQLTNLNLSNNAVLKDLLFDNNQLKNLDVSKNVALENLFCRYNQLTNLDFSKNVALQSLFCDFNQLTNLDFSKNTDLGLLNCNSNLLTALDVSKNIALRSLSCGYNQLTNLDVSMNTALEDLFCRANQLTNLNVSKNALLDLLNCSYNQLTSLDISMNTNLNYLICNSNRLTNLNLKNGKNVNFGDTDIDFTENPNLICIQVDDADYSNVNWPNKKNAYATYSTSCSWLGIYETVFDKIAVYPNPTKGELHIDNIILEKATVYDALGKLIKTTIFTSGDKGNTIRLTGLSKGIYYIYLESEGTNTAKKVIVE